MKKAILILVVFLMTCCASTALAISGGRIISHDFKIYQFGNDDYIDIFKLKNGETITKYCTKNEELVDVTKRRSHHDGVDRTTWIIKIVEE